MRNIARPSASRGSITAGAASSCGGTGPVLRQGRGRPGTVGALDLAPDEATVTLDGELDLANADQVAALLGRAIDAGRPRIAVHMAGVTFLESTILRVLLEAHRAAEATGRPLELHGLGGHPRRVVELSGLHLALRVVEGAAGEPRGAAPAGPRE